MNDDREELVSADEAVKLFWPSTNVNSRTSVATFVKTASQLYKGLVDNGFEAEHAFELTLKALFINAR